MWLAHLTTFWGLLPSLWAVLRSGRVLFRWIWSQLQNKLSSWKNDACANGAGVQEGWDEPEQEHGDDLRANPEGARAWCPNWIDRLNKEPRKKRKGFILSKVEKLFIYCWSMLDAAAKTVLTNWLQSFRNNFSVQHHYQPHHHHQHRHHHDRQARWAKDNRRNRKGHQFEGLGQWGYTKLPQHHRPQHSLEAEVSPLPNSVLCFWNNSLSTVPKLYFGTWSSKSW